MGLAGSGKSTQGNILAKELDGVWLSAGQVLRDTKNPEVNAIQERGELVPDTITIPLMAEAMQQATDAGKEIVLDGYPRTVEQANWIAENVADQVALVIRIEVPKEELFERMALRGRNDDLDRSAIEERFRIVGGNMNAVCKILQEHGIKIIEIDGVGSMEEVTERLHQALRENKVL